MPSVDPSAYELAFREAVRAVGQQDEVLDNLRTRVGVLLSAAAIVTSFFGGQALHRAERGAWTWVALALFALLALCAIAVVWPRREWGFFVSPSELIGTYVEAEEPLPVATIYRDLALHLENSHDEQRKRIEQLMLVFRLAALGLVLEVVAWVVEVGTAS